MKNFSIAKRLVFLALMALVFLLSVSAVAIYQMNAAQKRFEIVQTSVIPSIQVLNETSMQSAALRSAVRDFIIGGFLENDGLQQTQRMFIESLKEKIETNFNLYQEKYATTAENRALLEADRAAFKAYLTEVSDLFEKVEAKDYSGVSQHFSETGSFRRTALALIKAMADHAVENQKYADHLRIDGDREYEQGFNLLLGIGVLALVVMAGFSYLLIRGILHSLREIGTAIDSIEGKLDFTITAAVVGKDEIASVSEKLNRLVIRLRESLASILENALTISRSAEHLSKSSEEVAAASAHQSDAAAGMAASVEELTVSIAHVSDRSTEAHTLSVHSGEYSKSGETVINQTVDDISAIATSVKQASSCIAQLEESSSEITMVTAVIKDVAEQTNLLALNAAIEAARAGDHGRGFSVVADEVRKLAERTATSTTQITMMVESMRTITQEVSAAIDRAVELVSSGVSRANDANASIRKINEASVQAVSMVEEITDAIREQSQASTSIAGAVEGIAQMAEESSASAQNTAESARLLDEVAQRLESTVKQYQL